MTTSAPTQNLVPLRIITATAIFDGHDASIHIIRRLLQERGCELIHLGHNRSVQAVLHAACQEDVDALCISSYQGGHREYFNYLIEQLEQRGMSHIQVFAGGGGTISEVDAGWLEQLGVKRVYTAVNSAAIGLEGIADEIVALCREQQALKSQQNEKSFPAELQLARRISQYHNQFTRSSPAQSANRRARVVGITGTGGSGKSTLIDELVKTLLTVSSISIACIALDPSRQKTGGALLGDRIRMTCGDNPRVFFHSLAAREANTSLTASLGGIIDLLDQAGYKLILVETSGIGQADHLICDYVDDSIYVMSADYGAPGQLEKISMLDYADFIVINKADHRGSQDALSAVKKQWQRNHQQFELDDKQIPVFAIRASYYHDQGRQQFFKRLITRLNIVSLEDREVGQVGARAENHAENLNDTSQIIPVQRQYYLSEIAQQARHLMQHQQAQCEWVEQLQHIQALLDQANKQSTPALSESARDELTRAQQSLLKLIEPHNLQRLEHWDQWLGAYRSQVHEYQIRDKVVEQANFIETASHTALPVVALPEYASWKDRLNFLFQENLPGEFPYTAGVFKYKNQQEEPTRMFAGEGTPEDTNRRFFLLKQSQKATRLSTAFDPLVLYAKDPQARADVYGCIGMSGVSIATLDDMKKLYSGMDLCDANTSVSMTINGPASIVMAMFLNTAIDQQLELYLKQQGSWPPTEKKIQKQFKDRPQPVYQGALPPEHNRLGLALLGVDVISLVEEPVYEKIAKDVCAKIRGTLQADILKEDQAQNECLYSLEFSLQLMADVQKYFIAHGIRNFYSVSVSGYHIAEAGANPITQLAFTLANGFTLLEYYLSQGMQVDAFCSQFSFFFSNGMDAEYAVIGRVARRIWARAIRDVYQGNARSQKLKYHIQTSGRSLQAQDINLNDMRTTLQALYAVYDNCNSLHTNAYDEAVTTPTDESVHRALAIQLIINRELGLSQNQNPLQGSFIIRELTDLVEQAVYQEFERLGERGGVIGAMEYFYQRNKIQEESYYAEHLKYTGKQAVIGVNQFVDQQVEKVVQASRFIHSSDSQKQMQIDAVGQFKVRNQALYSQEADRLKQQLMEGQNSFAALLRASRYCSLQQMSDVLIEVGGEYRRKL